MRDDLDDFIADTARDNPEFPALVDAAVRRQELLHELSEARKSSGLTRTEVAARMGTSEAAVARLEKGDSEVLLSSALRYAAAAGLDLRFQVRRAKSA